MMLRTTALMLVLGAGLIARAQAPGFHYFQAAQPLTTAQLKLATEAVMNADPYAELFHSDDRTIVQVKSPQLQPEALYRAAIAAQAVTLLPGTRTPDELGVNTGPFMFPPAMRPPTWPATALRWRPGTPPTPTSR